METRPSAEVEQLARETLRQAAAILTGHFDCSKPATQIPSSEKIMREMFDELEDLGRSPRTLGSLRDCIRPFVRAFPRLEELTDADLVLYLRNISGKVGARRRDNILMGIVQLSRFARRRNYLPEDRRAAAEKIRKIKPGHDIDTWTIAETTLLLENISAHSLPWAVLGLFAGLRTSEIHRLDWSAIKFEQRRIAISQKIAHKIRLGRIVPMPDNLAAWLEPYRDRVGLLYPGKLRTNENARSLELARIRKLTGVQRKDNANRHSYGSYRLAVTKNAAQVALEMGNSPRMMRDNYNDPKSEEEGAAYFALFPPSLENVVPMPLALEFR